MLRGLGATRVLTLTLDVTDFDAIAGTLRHAATECGRLDILVVNAGVGYSLPVGKGKFDLVRRTLDTDLTAGVDVPKSDPRVVARKSYDVLEAGGAEVLADEGTVKLKASLSAARPAYIFPEG